MGEERGGAWTLDSRSKWQPEGYKSLVEQGGKSSLRARIGTHKPVGYSSCSIQRKAETPGAEEIRSRMPRLFSYILGVWLLLSQLPREIPGQSTNDFIKACGRELVRLWVEICGSVSWGRTALSLEEPQLETGPPAGMSSPGCSTLPIGCRPVADQSEPGSRPNWLPALSPDCEAVGA